MDPRTPCFARQWTTTGDVQDPRHVIMPLRLVDPSVRLTPGGSPYTTSGRISSPLSCPSTLKRQVHIHLATFLVFLEIWMISILSYVGINSVGSVNSTLTNSTAMFLQYIWIDCVLEECTESVNSLQFCSFYLQHYCPYLAKHNIGQFMIPLHTSELIWITGI